MLALILAQNLSEVNAVGIFERGKKYKAKKQNPSVETESVAMSELEDPQDLSITSMEGAERDKQQEQTVTVSPDAKSESVSGVVPPAQSQAPTWVTAGSYEEAVKENPNISRSQYAYELSKYRREQGFPDLSYAEWGNIVKGHNPYETEAERKKRERRMNAAKIFTGVSSVLGNLVNYVRAKNGHVAMNLDDGTQGYNRLERIRQNQEQLARSNAKDYLGYITMDRAERAKAQATAAAAAQAKQNYELKVKELEWKKENAKTEAERKKAADELAKMKFEETQRHNKEMEKTARIRANKTGAGSGTKKYLELKTGNGTRRYTPEEYGNNWIHKAYQDMLKEEEGKNYEVRTLWGNSPTEQQMYEAITKYNDSREKNQYRTGRYGGGSKAKPVWE